MSQFLPFDSNKEYMCLWNTLRLSNPSSTKGRSILRKSRPPHWLQIPGLIFAWLPGSWLTPDELLSQWAIRNLCLIIEGETFNSIFPLWSIYCTSWVPLLFKRGRTSWDGEAEGRGQPYWGAQDDDPAPLPHLKCFTSYTAWSFLEHILRI